ncbi:Uncharacterised protein [Yersinia rohdei]|uniref:hypothetical protein n=1 Tax=Yersinia rohdei TaxID=29485 RepID=UPI00061BB585|nr:hypothetical protein [Yersinia rohdei]CNF09648.1 Uncharacterised protein [Yersinia rohdei]
MRYFLVALSVTLAGCNGVNDKKLEEDVSSAVVEKIAVFNGREPCAEVMQKKRTGIWRASRQDDNEDMWGNF